MHRLALLLAAAILVVSCRPHAHSAAIVVGSKNFTESVLLGELVAQKLERAGCPVDRRLNMGGSLVCDSAIAAGSLDAYVEYSGTALTAILKQPASNDRAAVDRTVTAGYAKRSLRWGPALGFNNTFEIIVHKRYAKRANVHAITELPRLGEVQPGFGYEFAERPDGWSG